MVLVEERIELLKKAGFSKKIILSKLEKEFGKEVLEKANLLVEESFSKDNSKKRERRIIITSIVIATLIFLGLFVYYLFFSYSSFYSQKCENSPIIVSGDLIYRQRAFEALIFIEERNCDYLNFVSDNLSKIESSTPGWFSSGQYYTDKSTASIASFSGSTEYVSSIIIHEACHGYQNKKRLVYNESDCTLTMYNYLLNINASIQTINIVKQTSEFWPGYDFTSKDKDVFVQWKNSLSKT